eukprot:TRINITY_DN23026_c0_g1_i1.p1 TRINITY_DN23026_c0_g1~~TRINITY_DN23026_c0_g1_i1.p1  ORF type:complete len:604 (+),score=82.52 TRINITY_DN23026_c0_g1_i1:42-1814(+)
MASAVELVESDESSSYEFEATQSQAYGWCHSLARRKTLKAILAEAAANAEEDGGKLTLFDLLCIGIGGTIGSGVFALTGEVLPVAGPAATLSWCLAGLTCLLSAFAYMELSAKIPSRGSCYAFSYHGLGELWGILGACCLTLEYAVSGAGVARSWSAKFVDLTQWHFLVRWYAKGTFADNSTDALILIPHNCSSSEEKNECLIKYNEGRLDDHYLDFGAGLCCLFCCVILMGGTDFGKKFINSLTGMKVALVSFLIVAGFMCGGGDPFDDFMPNGPGGVMDGTVLLFFGFIGFDEVCGMAGKAENPSKVMPRALLGTLLGAAFFSGFAQLALSWMVEDYSKATSFEAAFEDAGWTTMSRLTGIGECVLMPVLVLITILPQSELTAAMSEDKVLPSIFKRQNDSGVFVVGTAIIGIATTLIAILCPFSILWNMISIGVLFGFQLTNASLINVRYGNGGQLRNRAVAKYVFGLLLTTACSAYPFWLGFLAPYLEGVELTSFHQIQAAIGAIFGLIAIGFLVAICRQEKVDGGYANGVYEAPGVPVVPGCAMYLNFTLMAGMSGSDHMYFAIAAGLFILGYLAYTGRGSKPAA